MFGIPKRPTSLEPPVIGIIFHDISRYTSNSILLPGTVSNPATFNFPVTYKPAKGIRTRDIIKKKPTAETGQRYVEAAKELEKEGVKAIATNCGFTIYFQEEIANAVNIPVFSSSLLQVPLVSRSLGQNQRVGIITWDSGKLSREHLRRAGIDESIPIAIKGLETLPHEKSWYSIDEQDLRKRLHQIEDRLVYTTKELLSKYSDIEAIVLECAELDSGAAAVQEATRLPIFSAVTLINWAYNSVVSKRFLGFAFQ
jgi:Asp/Glu/hydantoin racemase